MTFGKPQPIKHEKCLMDGRSDVWVGQKRNSKAYASCLTWTLLKPKQPIGDKLPTRLNGASRCLEVFTDNLVACVFYIKPHEDYRDHGEEGAKAHDNSPASRLRQDRVVWVEEGRLAVELGQTSDIGLARWHLEDACWSGGKPFEVTGHWVPSGAISNQGCEPCCRTSGAAAGERDKEVCNLPTLRQQPDFQTPGTLSCEFTRSHVTGQSLRSQLSDHAFPRLGTLSSNDAHITFQQIRLCRRQPRGWLDRWVQQSS